MPRIPQKFNARAQERRPRPAGGDEDEEEGAEGREDDAAGER